MIDGEGAVVVVAVGASQAGGVACTRAGRMCNRGGQKRALGDDASAPEEVQAVVVPVERHEWAAQQARREFDGMLGVAVLACRMHTEVGDTQAGTTNSEKVKLGTKLKGIT